MVLVLYGASPSLTESDFRRVVPRGKHITQWTRTGDIQKSERLLFPDFILNYASVLSDGALVIPGRDPETLAPLDFFFIVFAEKASALAYQEEALRLHKLAARHTIDVCKGYNPLSPERKMNGGDVNQTLQSYTLVPPTQQLQLKALYPPFTSSVQQIIDDGVYPPLINNVTVGSSSPRPSSPHAVCISVEGHLPPRGFPNDILGMTGGWYHTRVPWKVVDESDGGLIELNSPTSFPSNHSASSLPFHTSATASSRTLFKVNNDQLPEHNSSGTRWIVTFKDAAEARRFVRCWHRRRHPGIYTSTDDNKDSDDSSHHSAIINVDLLW